MTRRFAALAILVSTAVFTLIGVAVGELISRSLPHPSNPYDATASVFTAYFGSALAGFVAGAAISAFAVWLVGVGKND